MIRIWFVKKIIKGGKAMKKLLMLLVIGVLFLSGCTSQDQSTEKEALTSTQEGHNGDVVLEVKLDGDKIESIEVTSHRETEDLGDLALDETIRQIIDTQSVDVDVVAGATVSSMAVINGVKDVLIQAGILQTENEVSTDKEVQTLDTQLIVIGAGPSGLAAAIEAAQAGINVIVFEKTGVTGGAAKFGMGPLAIDTEYQEAIGEDLTVQEAYDMFMEYTHYRVDGNLVYEYFDMSSSTIDWLEDMGVKFQGAARYFEKSYASWLIVESDDGTKGGGQAETMTRLMTEYAQSLGVEFYLNTPVTKIDVVNGEVQGVVAVNENENIEYHATGEAVVVASGGFGNNEEMIKEELGYTWGEDYFGMKFPGHEGDGIKMALDAGAQKGNMNIEMIFNIYANDGPAITGDVMIMMRQPGLLVNANGERFFNEEQIQNTTYTGNALAIQPNNTGYMILDENIIHGYLEEGVDFESNVYQWEDLSTIFDTVERLMDEGSVSVFKGDVSEVAQYLGTSVDNLQKTINDYNEIVESGQDPLGKSEKYLRPIDENKLVVAQYFPGSYGTLGGIAVNSKLEVLDTNNQAIKGLYSAGTDSCEIFGDSYMFLLPGNTMGYALNSGRIAARNLTNYLQEGQ